MTQLDLDLNIKDPLDKYNDRFKKCGSQFRLVQKQPKVVELQINGYKLGEWWGIAFSFMPKITNSEMKPEVLRTLADFIEDMKEEG